MPTRPAALAGALVVACAARADAGPPRRPANDRTVVFACAHGNVKSLIASEWLNRRAAERGIAVRAVARGLTPENPVPPAIAESLRREGIDVAGFEAQALSPSDVEGVARLVMIGVEAPAWVERGRVPVEDWLGIPPASERYEESRDALRARIETLLDDIGSPKPEP